MGLAKELGVNGKVVCDCGSFEFFIGSQVDSRGNNFIRLLECTSCGKEMPTPFTSFVVPPPGPKVPKENVRHGS